MTEEENSIMSQQLKQCFGIMRKTKAQGQRLAECSCCGRQASVAYIGEACDELFCIICGKNESACICVPNQQYHGEVARQVELTMYQPVLMGLSRERW